jgi:hypothetical protein
VIFEILIVFLAGAWEALLAPLPVGNLSIDTSGLSALVGDVKALNTVLPIGSMLTIIALWLVMTQATFVLDGIMWLVRKLPFVGIS